MWRSPSYLGTSCSSQRHGREVLRRYAGETPLATQWEQYRMSPRKKGGKGKGISDNMVIVYSIVFCIFLVIYIRFIM